MQKLQKQMPRSVTSGSNRLGPGALISSALTQNQLVVLFGLTWLFGLLIVTIFLTQFS